MKWARWEKSSCIQTIWSPLKGLFRQQSLRLPICRFF
jgi:hypothetical protein